MASAEKNLSAQATDDDDFVISPSLYTLIEEAGDDAGEIWLWCLYCNRFFQAMHLRIDYLGNRQGCAFCACAGFDVAIHPWDAFATDGWPKDASELRHGMKCC